MVTNAPASRNPADNDSLAGVFKIVLDKHLQGIDDMLPAVVLAYNRAANRAQVQPLIAMVTTDNTVVQRAQVASVPVLQLGGSGFVLSFPLRAGDIGWIKANDRDISLFKSTYANASPNTQRKHSFEDALFIPDTFLDGVTIASEDAANMVLQNYAGTVRMAFWPTYIKFTTPGIGVGGNPDAHAILDVQSTTKAFMPPRMTQAQRDAIPSPAEGMMVWNVSNHTLSTYNGSAWS